MAIVNIGSAGTHTYNSADTVTMTASHTQGNGNSITKTDTNAMTILWANGVTVNFTGTGYIDCKGSRGAFVGNESNDSNPVRGKYNYYNFNGTSTSNTLHWNYFTHCTYGVIFSAHHPAEDKFKYMVFINITNQAGLYMSSGSGTGVLTDIAQIKSKGFLKNNAGDTVTYKRITILKPFQQWMGSVSKSATFEDCYFDCNFNGNMSFSVGSGETLTMNDCYFIGNNIERNFQYASAGDIDLTDCILKDLGQINWYHTGSGTASFVTCDIIGSNHTSFGGIHSTTTKCDMTSCYIGGNTGADIDDVDTSTNTPDSNSTPAQYVGATAVTTPVSTRNKDITHSGLSANVATAGQATFSVTTDMPADTEIWLTKTSGDYSLGVRISSGGDAPGIVVNGHFIPSYVTDWSENGKVYGTSHSILMDYIESGTYYWKAVSKGVTGEVFESAEQGSITVSSAAVFPAENKVVDDAGDFGPTGSEYTPNFADVSVNDVQTGVVWGGAGITKTGVFDSPAEEDVESGVGYGANGTEFTGSLPGADTTIPTWSGGVSGIVAADAATSQDVNVSCNSASDDTSLQGYKYYIKSGDNSPFASPDLTLVLSTNSSTKINVGSDTEQSIGVRAIDTAGNETTNTDYVTVTPTSPDINQYGMITAELSPKTFDITLTG